MEKAVSRQNTDAKQEIIDRWEKCKRPDGKYIGRKREKGLLGKKVFFKDCFWNFTLLNLKICSFAYFSLCWENLDT